MKRTTTNLLCIPRYFMHHITWSRLGMAPNFSATYLFWNVTIITGSCHLIPMSDVQNSFNVKSYQTYHILSNISKNEPQYEIRTIKLVIIAQWREKDARVTQEWHNGDTSVTLDNDTTVTHEWLSEARVMLDWRMSDAPRTLRWHNSDTTVTQQCHRPTDVCTTTLYCSPYLKAF